MHKSIEKWVEIFAKDEDGDVISHAAIRQKGQIFLASCILVFIHIPALSWYIGEEFSAFEHA